MDKILTAIDIQVWAVMIGAFLATGGGFAAAQFAERLANVRRERVISLICLDMIASMARFIEIADGARKIGDPYGPVTMRIVRVCQREHMIYERNRERLTDLTDARLRARIFLFMARLTISTEGVISWTDEITQLHRSRQALLQGSPSAPHAMSLDQIDAAIAEAEELRNQSFEFLLEVASDANQLMIDLGRIARAEPADFKTTAAPPTPGA